MKYAILGPQLGINRLSDTLPANLSPGMTAVEITDEQAATVAAARTATPSVFYFLVNGALLTMAEKFAADQAAHDASKTFTLEDWIAKVGFSGVRLPALMDLEGKLKAAGKSSAKLTAIRAWLDTNMARYAGGQTTATGTVWGAPPFPFEQVAADAMAALMAP